MPRSNFPVLIDFARRLADAARAETLPRFRCGVSIDCKEGAAFDPVTDADREAERSLRAMIAEAYPDHGIIGEEFGAERIDAEWRWVLDPVDGTRAFICGATTWATLIALEESGGAALGVIDQPFTDERWIGLREETTHERAGTSRRCRVSGVTALKDARLSTTDPRAEGYFTADEAAAFSRVAARTRVCRFSFDAYAYGLLALGELDLVIESSLKHHDWAALIPIVEGAGGVISGWRGEPLAESPHGRIIAAATGDLHAQAIELLTAT